MSHEFVHKDFQILSLPPRGPRTNPRRGKAGYPFASFKPISVSSLSAKFDVKRRSIYSS
jgi:hypothetical protein